MNELLIHDSEALQQVRPFQPTTARDVWEHLLVQVL